MIIRAARILENRGEEIRVDLIGKGQTSKEMMVLAEWMDARSVAFLPPMTMEMIAYKIAASDVCLGIFGVTGKASRVIPNKAYEVLQCGKPLITARTPASERILKDGDTALLTEPGNPHVLANAILRLKNDPILRHRLAENGHRLAMAKFQPLTIVQPIAKWLSNSAI